MLLDIIMNTVDGKINLFYIFVRNFLDEHLNWNDEKTHIYEPGTIDKYAISGRNKCNQILHFLYDDATIYLNRKYNLYKTYVAVDKSRD